MLAVAVGLRHACAITRMDRTLLCWGSNTHGQEDVPSGRYMKISAGRDHTCALTDPEGHPVCWGLGPRSVAEPSAIFSHLQEETYTGSIDCSRGTIRSGATAAGLPTGTDTYTVLLEFKCSGVPGIG